MNEVGCQIAAEIDSEVNDACVKDLIDVSWNVAYSTSAKRLCVRNCVGLSILAADVTEVNMHSTMAGPQMRDLRISTSPTPHPGMNERVESDTKC